jgi:hypothetical protein
MKKALPGNAKIAKDAKETVQECVSEFISFITSEWVHGRGRKMGTKFLWQEPILSKLACPCAAHTELVTNVSERSARQSTEMTCCGQ